MIICTRKKPSRRKLETVSESWAILGLAALWRKQALSFSDEGFCSSVVQQWESSKKLTPRQWEVTLAIARRYAQQLGAEPDPIQLSLLDE